MRRLKGSLIEKDTLDLSMIAKLIDHCFLPRKALGPNSGLFTFSLSCKIITRVNDLPIRINVLKIYTAKIFGSPPGLVTFSFSMKSVNLYMFNKQYS